MQVNKNKILNDPVYGFITIPNDLIFDIIEHPYFQRLRRIKQLGLTNLVYPGALHTRFHHAIGAMHLMSSVMENLRLKGIEISDDEITAAQLAILLHDIGHGPFSHTLEFSLIQDIKHEDISLLFFKRLNKIFSGALDMAIAIFEGSYHRKFFCQLVSSQLDIDRIDYLKRDSYFTGVSEGAIGTERILKMVNVRNDEIVVEEKGIYSIENFLSSRRLMYWQVYLHKTSVSAEHMLIELIKRARVLSQAGVNVIATPALKIFLERNISPVDFHEDPDIIDIFSLMDDNDIWGSMKFWRNHDDYVLSSLSNMLLDRKIFQVRLGNEKIPKASRNELTKEVSKQFDISPEEAAYFVGHGEISNAAYILKDEKINILTKHGEVVDIVEATDLPNITAMSKVVTKHYLCWPKELKRSF